MIMAMTMTKTITKIIKTTMMRIRIKTGNCKSIENEEIIMTMTMTKTIITKVIIIMMRMRITIGNHVKI